MKKDVLLLGVAFGAFAAITTLNPMLLLWVLFVGFMSLFGLTL